MKFKIFVIISLVLVFGVSAAIKSDDGDNRPQRSSSSSSGERLKSFKVE